MYVKNIKLTNYRNYSELFLDFEKNANVFVGKNAQGKTNIVEALYILSTLKSFRNSKLNDCIKENEKSAIIEAEVFVENFGSRKIKMIINKEGENQYFVNNNKLTKKSDMFGNLYSVIFSPDELFLIKGGPDVRREFLDLDISQVSSSYVKLIERYETILLSRNKILKFNKNSKNIDTLLDVWDEQLALVGGQISIARQNFILKLNDKAIEATKFISDGRENLKIDYICIEGETRQEKSDNILKSLKANRLKDLELGYTTIGPHRDDLKFYINDKEVKPFASQGQQRLVVLALKLSELETIKNEYSAPILILDDVFSELDKTRQINLSKYLVDNQIFITGTAVSKSNFFNCKKFRVTDAKVKISR